MRKLILTVTLAAAVPALADEGMWTFDNFPAAAVKQKYGADITPEWLDRVRRSTVRLANCTASFVSPEGLMLTNHHCIESCLAELSTKESSLIETGFKAADRAGERRCATQVADVLVEMQDVSAEVAKAIAGLADAAANEARKKALTNLEQACETASRKNRRTGPLKCESVTLYQGGQYFLYKYRRYDDVRLVFAPERDIAAFGGDPDNFQFPRWSLDFAFLRAWENGKPARTPDHLAIDFTGPDKGEVVFVSGHPGSTSRLQTTDQLRFERDVLLPSWLIRNSELRGRYLQFATTGPEAARIVESPLNNLENSLKVRRKQLDALHDDDELARKAKEEAELKARYTGSTDPWADVARASAREREIYFPYLFVEQGAGFNSQLFRYARALVRGAAERAKPNQERLREFSDTALPRLEQQLGAPVPVYPELEVLTMSLGFERLREWLGPDDALVKQLLSKESPRTLAERLVAGTKLADPAERKRLWEGGAAAIAASSDPMIVLARTIDADARALRKQYEDEVEAPTALGSERIAAARFAALGTGVYPDATFTLRLNYGSVQAWREKGVDLEPFTRLDRLFERATGATPFKVPESWERVKGTLDLDTPYTISTNSDIVGGNSGSPLIDAQGRIVGLIFDGNIHSISGDYWFDTEKNRAIAVHPAIIREALQKVYGAEDLLRELARE
jgi:hypothetical protein